MASHLPSSSVGGGPCFPCPNVVLVLRSATHTTVAAVPAEHLNLGATVAGPYGSADRPRTQTRQGAAATAIEVGTPLES